MSTRNIALIAIFGLILILGGCGCSSYNGLVSKDEDVRAKWANVQSEYQRRNDLIGNLVEDRKSVV